MEGQELSLVVTLICPLELPVRGMFFDPRVGLMAIGC